VGGRGAGAVPFRKSEPEHCKIVLMRDCRIARNVPALFNRSVFKLVLNGPLFLGVLAFNLGASWMCAQTTAPAPDTVVARIDGKDVTADQVRRMIAVAPPAFFTAFKADPANAIRNVYVMRELADEAEKAGVANESPWKEQIEFMKQNTLAGAMVTRQMNAYHVPEEQTEKFYQDNLTRFERSSISVIKIGFAEGAPATGSPNDLAAAARGALENAHNQASRSEADAKKLADSIVGELRAGGDFKKLAAQYSDDQETRNSGGDFGSITGSSAYPDALKKAALALKEGGTSDPVKVSTAYYIIRCDKQTVQSYKDVHDSIVNELKQQHRNQFLKDLDQRFTPSAVNSDALSQIANGK
jgi:hypothetical protein